VEKEDRVLFSSTANAARTVVEKLCEYNAHSSAWLILGHDEAGVLGRGTTTTCASTQVGTRFIESECV